MSTGPRFADAPVIRDWLRVSSGPAPAVDVAWMRRLRAAGEKLDYIRFVTGYPLTTVHRNTLGFHPSEQPGLPSLSRDVCQDLPRKKADRQEHLSLLSQWSQETTRGFASVKKSFVEQETAFSGASNV